MPFSLANQFDTCISSQALKRHIKDINSLYSNAHSPPHEDHINLISRRILSSIIPHTTLLKKPDNIFRLHKKEFEILHSLCKKIYDLAVETLQLNNSSVKNISSFSPSPHKLPLFELAYYLSGSRNDTLLLATFQEVLYGDTPSAELLDFLKMYLLPVHKNTFQNKEKKATQAVLFQLLPSLLKAPSQKIIFHKLFQAIVTDHSLSIFYENAFKVIVHLIEYLVGQPDQDPTIPTHQLFASI